jgi:hypothetical protein
MIPPTSPITPRLEDIEHYEQDNMSKSSLTMQQELEQAGKLGLHLIEELKAKNQIIEDLANRLRMIYSAPNTPDLTVGGSHEFLSNSFLSSIRGPSSSRTVSPVLPSGILNECMDRAEKEVARLDQIVLTQTREIEALRQDLHAASDLLANERERFKEDRVKLKKEIMELQVVLKRKDQFASTAILRAKDRLTCLTAGVQTEDRGKKNFGINVDFGDLNELEDLRKTLDGILSKEHVCESSQTDPVLEGLVDRVNVYSETIALEREVFESEIARLNDLLREKSLEKEVRTVGAMTEVTVSNGRGVNTDSPIVYSTGSGEEIAKRCEHESVQTIPQDDLAEENRKLKEKYLRYRNEFAQVVEKRKSASSVGSNTVDPLRRSYGVETDIEFKSRVDRGTCKTPQIVSDGIVQVDDDRDEKLFLAESDLTMLAEDREVLLAEREKIIAELFRIKEERDSALDRLEKVSKEQSIESEIINTVQKESVQAGIENKPVVVSVGCETDAISSPPTDRVEEGWGTEETARHEFVFTSTGPVELGNPESISGNVRVESKGSCTDDAPVKETHSFACGTERIAHKTVGTDPVEFVVEEVINQLSETAVGDVSMASCTVEQSTLVVGDLVDLREVGVTAEDHVIEALENEIMELKLLLESQKKNQPLLQDMSTCTLNQEECAPTPLLDVSDLSPTSLAVRLDEYMAKGPLGDNQLIRSLQKRLLAAEKTMKEKTEFFKLELERMRQQTVEEKRGPVSPLPKLLGTDGSPKHPQSRLDARDLVSYYQLGEQGPIHASSPPEFDLSEISKPVPSQTTVEGCSPGAATFDFSISQQTLVSSLSPLRIPFTTPVPKDRDGDVIMNTAPKTQIRNQFAVHQDVAKIEEEPSSLFESAGAENVASLQAKNGDLEQRMRSVRNKAMQIKNMTNRLWSLTGSI